ncbi:hypothetical protein RF55_17961 [Lasius niger]|uniref:HAUS augmin-like complex subunit 6 N-terminal domain-containing protein n=1 Tax=Lasius niger TaxID=67767 RepID=A0A0J7K1J4_LASNI|nr:hypothetical protein RF55_17961 [Lasius niger]
MIYDAERFRKLVEWPVLCKKTEAKYRNDVKDYLNVIAVENPDIGFPNIVATYLHHASGTKFMLIMWKLSQLAVKKYLMRYGREEKEQLASIKTELFNKKQSVTKCIITAPVAASIKQRLKNVEDSEIIQS